MSSIFNIFMFDLTHTQKVYLFKPLTSISNLLKGYEDRVKMKTKIRRTNKLWLKTPSQILASIIRKWICTSNVLIEGSKVSFRRNCGTAWRVNGRERPKETRPSPSTHALVLRLILRCYVELVITLSFHNDIFVIIFETSLFIIKSCFNIIYIVCLKKSPI